MKMILLFLITSLTAFGQSAAKEAYLFDENEMLITQETFNKKAKSGQYTWVISETKDSINARLILKEEYGHINNIQKQTINRLLKGYYPKRY